ncbi:MAG: hypothetical protein Tsb0021_16650 [Chlamydiales bacterium]
MEDVRLLLYPLGFLSAIPFLLRFLIQWWASEQAQRSVVPPLFWKLSLLGNGLLMLHGCVQLQFHVSLLQSINGVISWRNLNLAKSGDSRRSFPFVTLMMGCAAISIWLIFLFQGYIGNEFVWMRTPSTSTHEALHPIWHYAGTIGLVLFASRFWIQWWQAEMRQESQLTPLFWWISLIGAFLSCLYFFKIHDPVNFLGPGIGLFTYIRNLTFIRRSRYYPQGSLDD